MLRQVFLEMVVLVDFMVEEAEAQCLELVVRAAKVSYTS